MAPVKKSVLDSLLNGQLQASTTIISDSLVQPALLLFRELIESKLERQEAVHLVCCEIDSTRFVESLCPDGNYDKLAGLQVLDCNMDADTGCSKQSGRPDVLDFEVDDVASLSIILNGLESEDPSHTTIFFDSINALETYNSSSKVLRMFRQCKSPIVAIYHTDLAVSPEASAASSKSPLLPLLLTASGSRSSIHLTLHPCALLAHLHYVYGIENVGQSRQAYSTIENDKDENEIDWKTYQFLDLLHQRGWGSPLAQGEHDASTIADEESYGGREYDHPSASRVVLDLLGCASNSHGGAAGRCVVENALRGVNKSNKRSDASKIVRGLEGLKTSEAGSDGSPSLSVTRVSEVLRIKRRTASQSNKKGDAMSAPDEDPFKSSMFNLGLTDRQREDKDKVELPFTRGGGEANGSGAIIIYEPDSADDLDDSDPDEDLEL